MKKLFVLGFTLLSVCCTICGEGFLAAGKDGIFWFEEQRAGKLVLELGHISYLVKDFHRNFYYAALTKKPDSKLKGGAVALLVRENGKFSLREVFDLGKHTPAHITISPDGRFLHTANYSQGTISEIALQENGSMKSVRFIQHSGKSILKRQRSPHPHQCWFDLQNRELLVCDLGTDEIFVYGYSAQHGIETSPRKKLKLAPGSGPRHLVFAPDGKTLYCANELAGTVTGFFRSNGHWQPGKTVPTLVEPFQKNFPGAIKITKCGKFLLVSNRGHNSIAIFETFANGDFSLLETVKIKGDYPFDILFLNNDRTVAVCNYKSDSVMLFKFDKLQKKLLPEAEYTMSQPKALVK